MALSYPVIDPVALELGPIVIRWYALAYIAGLLGGWQYASLIARQRATPVTPVHLEQFLFWATLGVILGGRLGYVLFYDLPAYVDDPLGVFKLWQGGMSFHGGFAGVVVAAILYAKKHRLPLWNLGDLLALAAPIGLFFGRIANFINGELYGRPTDVSWGMVFPNAGPWARHPSQLYEAVLEGLVLFLVLFWLMRRGWMEKLSGGLVAVFLIGYGSARFFVEFFRQPDSQLGLHWELLSQGQLLSLPMIIIGVLLLKLRRDAVSE